MSLGNARTAYTQTQNLGGNPRSTEARALMEAARRLSDARQTIDQDMEGYRTALRLNWRLWTIIQCDVASPENPLPPELKANIISLSIFVDRQTLGALSEPSAAKLNVLIDINRNIAAGLMARPEAAAAVPEQKAVAGGPVAV
jgi:flagellar biosynthesis activator protein FlaF